MNMKKMILGAAVALGLAACGGGGGSPGQTTQSYSIQLRADKTQLPVNLANTGPGIGAGAAYTTTLYVDASQGGMPIPSGTEIFQCAVTSGLDSAVLYYLDGTDKKDDQGVMMSSRSIVLGSNSGSASFHLHAINKAGVATVTCTVTDPRDKRVLSASVNVTVGGAVQNTPASVTSVTQTPGYLGSRDNITGLRNNVAIEARVFDDRNQPVTSTVPNVLVRILPNFAYEGARLISGSQAGSSLQVGSLNGVAQFSLSSGPSSGVILLETIADRSDNNVSNGVQDPIRSLSAVGVYDQVASTALAFTGQTIAGVKNQSLASALVASGGLPPYRWSVVSGLPDGLQLSSDGVLSGTPTVAGSFNMVARVTDNQGSAVTSNVAVNIAASAVLDFTAPSVTGRASQSVAYAFTATGGKAPYTWSSPGGIPSSLQLSSAGILSGTAPATTGAFNMIVRVTDADNNVVTKNVTFTVAP
ncbi:putative Ig domain-containing protein [Delftia sp. PS-11]|uniref:putative Ig domain-containing protein n=1 Tax=Delftia sp. PS-11 TaxID=2767222 RepID=UPI0024560590|nr:putative Ig domain-containing protein [Delftia sp. PS-11]